MYTLGSLADQCLLKKTKKNYWQIRLIQNYNQLVGKIIASNSKLYYIDRKKAIIICRNSVWMNELKNREEELIEKFNQFIGKDCLDSIQLKIGNIDKTPLEKSKKKVELTVQEEEWIEHTSLLVPESLQNRFRSMLVAYKELKKP